MKRKRKMRFTFFSVVCAGHVTHFDVYARIPYASFTWLASFSFNGVTWKKNSDAEWNIELVLLSFVYWKYNFFFKPFSTMEFASVWVQSFIHKIIGCGFTFWNKNEWLNFGFSIDVKMCWSIFAIVSSNTLFSF